LQYHLIFASVLAMVWYLFHKPNIF